MIDWDLAISTGVRWVRMSTDLPTAVLGRAAGTIKTGRRVIFRRETPMCNLFLAMMDRMGVRMEHFGDSTGNLQGLDLG